MWRVITFDCILRLMRFKLLTWYVMVQVNSPTTDLTVSPACWGVGNSGRRHDVIQGGAGSWELLLIYLTSVKDAGQWYVVVWPSQCSPCSCCTTGLNVMCFCSGLVFSSVWSACWLPATAKLIEVNFYNAWNLELSLKCHISRAASWLVRKISLLASGAPNGKPCEVCRWELVLAVRIHTELQREGDIPWAAFRSVSVSQSVCAYRLSIVIDILIRAYLCFCFKIVTYLHQLRLNCCCDRKCFFVDNYFTFSILLSGFLTTYGVSVFHLFTPCSCQACLLLKISKQFFSFVYTVLQLLEHSTVKRSQTPLKSPAIS